eukprot:GHVH01008109.1.p1 GENE.GHVH01008109.1~~GHVH01008109.1.p1  ORF type:complete len:1072 (+),score=147.10 GHVH01008109.1:42-3218(+)
MTVELSALTTTVSELQSDVSKNDGPDSDDNTWMYDHNEDIIKKQIYKLLSSSVLNQDLTMKEKQEMLEKYINKLKDDKMMIVQKLEKAIARGANDFMDELMVTADCLDQQKIVKDQIRELKQRIYQFDRSHLIETNLYLTLICNRRSKIQQLKTKLGDQLNVISTKKTIYARLEVIMALVVSFDNQILSEVSLQPSAIDHTDTSDSLYNRFAQPIGYKPVCISRLKSSFDQHPGTGKKLSDPAILQPIHSVLLGNSTCDVEFHKSFDYFDTISCEILASTLKSKKNPKGILSLYVLQLWTVEVSHILNSWTVNRSKGSLRGNIARICEVLWNWLSRFDDIFLLNRTARVKHHHSIQQLFKDRAAVWGIIEKRFSQTLNGFIKSEMQKLCQNDAFEIMYLLLRFIRSGELFVQRKSLSLRNFLDDPKMKQQTPRDCITIQTQNSPLLMATLDTLTWDRFKMVYRKSIGRVFAHLSDEDWERRPVPESFSLFSKAEGNLIIPMVDCQYSEGFHDGALQGYSNPFTGYHGHLPWKKTGGSGDRDDKDQNWPMNIILSQVYKKRFALAAERELVIIEQRIEQLGEGVNGGVSHRAPVITRSALATAATIEEFVSIVQINPEMTVEVIQGMTQLIELTSYYIAKTLLSSSWSFRLTQTDASPKVVSTMNIKQLTHAFAIVQDQARHPHLTGLLKELQRIRSCRSHDSLDARSTMIKEIIDHDTMFQPRPELSHYLHRFGAGLKITAIESLQTLLTSVRSKVFDGWKLRGYLKANEMKQVDKEWIKCQHIVDDLKSVIYKDIARLELSKNNEALLLPFRSVNWISNRFSLSYFARLTDLGILPTSADIEGFSDEDKDDYESLVSSQIVNALNESSRFFDDIYIGVSCLGRGSIPLPNRLLLWEVMSEEFYKMWLYFMVAVCSRLQAVGVEVDGKRVDLIVDGKDAEISAMFQRLLLASQFITKLMISYKVKIMEQMNDIGIERVHLDICVSSTSLDAMISFVEAHSLEPEEIVNVGKFWVGKGAFDLNIITELLSRRELDVTKRKQLIASFEYWAVDRLSTKLC